MNGDDQLRVRVTVTVARSYTDARRSYVVERMDGESAADVGGVLDGIEEALRNEVIRLYRAAYRETQEIERIAQGRAGEAVEA